MAARPGGGRHRVVEGGAGGGVVRIIVTGGGEVLDVTISPEAVDPDDVEMLEDLVSPRCTTSTTQIAAAPRRRDGRPRPGAMLGGLSGCSVATTSTTTTTHDDQ